MYLLVHVEELEAEELEEVTAKEHKGFILAPNNCPFMDYNVYRCLYQDMSYDKLPCHNKNGAYCQLQTNVISDEMADEIFNKN